MFRYLLVLIVVLSMPVQAVRLALVIGNGGYNANRNGLGLEYLHNPVNDANDMAEVLRNLGFEVILKTDADKKTMKDAAREFGKRLRNFRQETDVGLFYYSGHGFQYNKVNYLMPLRVDIQHEVNIEDDALRADYVLRFMKHENKGVNIVILDACRSDILENFWRQNKGFFDDLVPGLAEMKAPANSLIAYATQPNTDSWSGLYWERNSLYTKHLLAKLQQMSHLSVMDVFFAVRDQVMQETEDEKIQQVPWESVSLRKRLCFGQCSNVSTIIDKKINIVQPPVRQPPVSTTLPSKWKTIKAHRGGRGGAICFECLAFNPDGQFLLSGSWDNTLKLFNINTGKLVRTFKGHSDSIYSVAFSPDGQQVLSGSYDDIKLWNLSTGKLIRTFNEHSSSVWSVVFSPDGQRVLSGSSDKTIKLWELSTGELIRTLKGHSFIISSVTFSPDGQRALSGSWDNTLKLWELSTGELIRTFKGHSDSIYSVAFSHDGQKALSGSDDKTIKLWDLSTGQLIRTFKGHSSYVNSVAFSPDGRFIASGSTDKTVKLWELSSGKLIRTLKGHKNYVFSVTFSQNGRLASGDLDGVIKLWR